MTTTINLEFGKSIQQEALQLKEQGKDANQTAGILCKKDPKGQNYGIGIVLDGNGTPWPSSATLLNQALEEVKNSQAGSYVNSASLMLKAKEAILTWQRIPKEHWDHFSLALPSDAGTGSVQTAITVSTLLNSALATLKTEELGWPAYKALAKTGRLDFNEFSIGQSQLNEKTLLLHQAGPMNTTGAVKTRDVISAQAQEAGQANASVVLDRAYSGFEFASELASSSYDEVMKTSYQLQIAPFIENHVPFTMALSPTKAFVTFALRPCGFLLVYNPDASQKEKTTLAINTAMRARGSSFEHPITRAFVQTLVSHLSDLEDEHANTLKRLAEAEALWKKLSKGTAIEFLYTKAYAGLFRNPKAKEDAAVNIYNEHIYPVFAQGRCRQNITGLPNNEDIAKKHVDVFARYCFK